MKRYFFLMFFVIVVSSTSLIKAVGSNPLPSTIKPVAEAKLSQAEIDAMVNRIDQIRNMDVHNMNIKERYRLKKEVIQIKKSMAISGNGGIYLSGTAIIIVILLLILLL